MSTTRARNESRIKRRESAIWQRRYWEHQIRNDEDLQKHFDTILYNPVKHGLVTKVCDAPWSSFYRYVKEGHYGLAWGGEVEVHLESDDMFGE